MNLASWFLLNSLSAPAAASSGATQTLDTRPGLKACSRKTNSATCREGGLIFTISWPSTGRDQDPAIETRKPFEWLNLLIGILIYESWDRCSKMDFDWSQYGYFHHLMQCFYLNLKNQAVTLSKHIIWKSETGCEEIEKPFCWQHFCQGNVWVVVVGTLSLLFKKFDKFSWSQDISR